MRKFQFHSFVQNFLLRLQDFSENLFSFFKSGLNLADKGYFFKHILPGVLSALKWLNLELFNNFVRNVIQNYDLMVVFPFVKFFDILCFLLCQISFNVLCVKVHEVYFYWFSKHRERIFNLFPFIFTYILSFINSTITFFNSKPAWSPPIATFKLIIEIF